MLEQSEFVAEQEERGAGAPAHMIDIGRRDRLLELLGYGDDDAVSPQLRMLWFGGTPFNSDNPVRWPEPFWSEHARAKEVIKKARENLESKRIAGGASAIADARSRLQSCIQRREANLKLARRTWRAAFTENVRIRRELTMWRRMLRIASPINEAAAHAMAHACRDRPKWFSVRVQVRRQLWKDWLENLLRSMRDVIELPSSIEPVFNQPLVFDKWAEGFSIKDPNRPSSYPVAKNKITLDAAASAWLAGKEGDGHSLLARMGLSSRPAGPYARLAKAKRAEAAALAAQRRLRHWRPSKPYLVGRYGYLSEIEWDALEPSGARANRLRVEEPNRAIARASALALKRPPSSWDGARAPRLDPNNRRLESDNGLQRLTDLPHCDLRPYRIGALQHSFAGFGTIDDLVREVQRAKEQRPSIDSTRAARKRPKTPVRRSQADSAADDELGRLRAHHAWVMMTALQRARSSKPGGEPESRTTTTSAVDWLRRYSR